MLIFIGLLNICLVSDLYQPQQKQLLLSWKQKIGSIWHTLTATLETPHGNQKIQTSWQKLSSLSRRSSLQNWQRISPDHGGRPVQHPNHARENITFMPYQDNFMFQQRRSDPNIKFSSSYSSSAKKTFVFEVFVVKSAQKVTMSIIVLISVTINDLWMI